MDDLDTALAKREAAPIEEAASAVLEMVRGLGSDTIDLGRAETREQAVEAYEVLQNLSSILGNKARAIRTAFLRHMVLTGNRKLIVGYRGHDARVIYEPPRNSYVVPGNEVAAMHKELGALIPEGLLTAQELEEAVRPVVSYQMNHAKLNALSRRSDQLREVIDAHRKLEPADPMRGKIEFPGD